MNAVVAPHGLETHRDALTCWWQRRRICSSAAVLQPVAAGQWGLLAPFKRRERDTCDRRAEDRVATRVVCVSELWCWEAASRSQGPRLVHCNRVGGVSCLNGRVVEGELSCGDSDLASPFFVFRGVDERLSWQLFKDQPQNWPGWVR